jgi:menaquinone-9 beta-reductase
MKADVDVLVVGAGPAGTAAGIEAQRRGLDVLVVDKARFPRDKTCGDGLTAGALRLLERLGLDVRSLPGYTTVRETILVGPDGIQVSLPLPAGGEYASVVPRIELDAALVDLARVRGVDVRDGVALSAIAMHDEHVEVTLTGGERLHARFVIAADGHYSFVRRCVRSDAPDLGTWYAFRQYFTGVPDRRLTVLFEEDLLPGYAWVFPLANDRANVGLGVLRRESTRGGSLGALWRDFLVRPSLRRVLGPDAQPEEPRRAWPIPAALDLDALTHERALFAGDAAGVVDPLTGEGIAQAIETGLLAVEAIVEAGPSTAPVAAAYRESVRLRLGRDLRFASALQRVLGSPRGARLALKAAGLTAWTRRNFARWMFEDYPRAVVLTPDRWQRGMFHGPGAYRRSA